MVLCIDLQYLCIYVFMYVCMTSFTLTLRRKADLPARPKYELAPSLVEFLIDASDQ